MQTFCRILFKGTVRWVESKTHAAKNSLEIEVLNFKTNVSKIKEISVLEYTNVLPKTVIPDYAMSDFNVHNF